MKLKRLLSPFASADNRNKTKKSLIFLFLLTSVDRSNNKTNLLHCNSSPEYAPLCLKTSGCVLLLCTTLLINKTIQLRVERSTQNYF